jgi:Dimerisation domain
VPRIGRGYQLSQALYVAARLRVADVLGSEPLSAEAVAEEVHARSEIRSRRSE